MAADRQGTGLFTVSLDFELFWGVHHSRTLDEWRPMLLQGRAGIPRLLNMSARFGVHCTWATVGLLLCESREEMADDIQRYAAASPAHGRTLRNALARVGANEREDPYHYAGSLVTLIRSYPHQEVGSHTATHLFCLNKDIDERAFEADLHLMNHIAARSNQRMSSVVFPKNQIPQDWLGKCRVAGLDAFRGPQPHWVYKPRGRDGETKLIRALRFFDSALAYTGRHDHRLNPGCPLNVPASAFLYPTRKMTRPLAAMRLKRICDGIAGAGRNNTVFHIWWHPESISGEADFAMLQAIFEAYLDAREKYGMRSLNMSEIAAEQNQ